MPIALVDPRTRKPTGDTFSAEDALHTLMQHPAWCKNGQTMRAQRAIWNAWDAHPNHCTIELAEADWDLLVACIRTPQHMTPNGPAEGIGLNPAMVWQVVPMFEAIESAAVK